MSDPTAYGHMAASLTSDLDTPGVALAVGAHPDDVDFGCGGTLAKWAAAGCEVHYLVCTDGSKGSWNPGQNLAELIALRQAEQTRASEELGGKGRVTFLGEVDGELGAGLELRGRVAHEIRRVRPDVVLGHDPWKRYRLHPDHRHAGWLACDGVVAARDPHFFPEQELAHHRPSALLLWEADEPDHAEDVTAFVDTKLAALEAHASQLESTMKAVDDDGMDAFRRRIRTRLAEHGRRIGVEAAELFKAITDL